MNNPATAVAQPVATRRASLVEKMAARYSVDPDKFLANVKSTAFRVKDREATNDELMALLIVANEYGLNPYLKEIYAFPAKGGGIVPIVGYDGWVRLMNEHPEYAGHDTETGPDDANGFPAWIECRMFRKDRPDHPTIIREYMAECRRDTEPWRTHPRRMLRTKTLNQTIRLAFGFAGVYDPDEADRVIEGESVRQVERAPAALASINAAVAGTVVPPIVGGQTIEGESVRAGEGAKTFDAAADTMQTAADTMAAIAKDTGETFAAVMDAVNKATTPDAVDIAEDRIRFVRDLAHQAELRKAAAARRKELQADDGK